MMINKKLLKQLKLKDYEDRLIEIETNNEDGFVIGIFVSYNDNFIKISSYNSEGIYDGECFIPIDDINKIKDNTKYLKKIEELMERNKADNGSNPPVYKINTGGQSKFTEFLDYMIKAKLSIEVKIKSGIYSSLIKEYNKNSLVLKQDIDTREKNIRIYFEEIESLTFNTYGEML